MSARILIVDDTPANLRLLEAKLTAEYFEVLTAENGTEGLEKAQQEQPDLILLDVMMPKMDGFEVCRQLRTDRRTWHIPVVMVTALTEASDRVKGLEAGADDFLSKPLNDIALFARVRSLVRLKTLIDELRDRQEAAGLEVIDQAAIEQGKQALRGKVLLVNDQVGENRRIVEALEGDSHQVRAVEEPGAALEASREDPELDLAIVALDLDGKDGLRLCGQLRSNEATRHLPILLLLEDSDLSRLAKGLDLGVTDYLFRPLDPNELLARVRIQVRRRRYHKSLRGLLDRGMLMAFTDPLTGLYNRRYMEVYMRRKLEELAETGKPLTLMLVDIDRFKEVNDSYGHTTGDAVLKSISDRVADGVRDIDLVARYGGEEILIAMPDTGVEQARHVAERLRRKVEEEPVRLEALARPLHITVSVGLAVTADPQDGLQALVDRADAALYCAKRAGRNCVSLSADC